MTEPQSCQTYLATQDCSNVPYVQNIGMYCLCPKAVNHLFVYLCLSHVHYTMTAPVCPLSLRIRSYRGVSAPHAGDVYQAIQRYYVNFFNGEQPICDSTHCISLTECHPCVLATACLVRDTSELLLGAQPVYCLVCNVASLHFLIIIPHFFTPSFTPHFTVTPFTFFTSSLLTHDRTSTADHHIPCKLPLSLLSLPSPPLPSPIPVDAEKQMAINLFLGMYCPQDSPHHQLWPLSTDYYLHHRLCSSLNQDRDFAV